MAALTPHEIVAELDRHIVGQHAAKRAVAIALRNRWRRQQVGVELRAEITPKNILMIGPTGVGKTEIARRLARLADAPFIKVEATKFTEVGYVGKDVDTIIRDLADIAVKQARSAAKEQVRARALDAQKSVFWTCSCRPRAVTLAFQVVISQKARHARHFARSCVRELWIHVKSKSIWCKLLPSSKSWGHLAWKT